MLGATFKKCINAILFAKLSNSSTHFWPPYTLAQQFKVFSGINVPFKTRTTIVFNFQCLKTSRTWKNYLCMIIVALNHQWDTTMVDNLKAKAQTLSQFNKLIHISIGKGIIANCLQVCRLN